MHINMRNTGQNQKLYRENTIENMLVVKLKENTRSYLIIIVAHKKRAS